MKKILLLLAFAFITGVRAQTPAPAPAPDAAKLALARETIKAMQADKMIDGMSANLSRIINQIAAAPANASPEQRAKAEVLSKRLMELSLESVKDMVTKMDAVYAEIYTEAELKAVYAFFVSAEGQSMIAKQPLVMQRVMPLVQSMQRELLPKIQKLVEEAKAEEAAAQAASSAKTPTTKTTEPAK